ncbi:MAG: hypothetical protein JXA99_04550 [Candidatus Lokiarchaeota archaeon]|nr:hypothetical protein [Candidatus Lokiarchaeota archaeon]
MIGYCTNCNEIVNIKRYYNKVSLLISCLLGLIIGLALYLIYYSYRPKFHCCECNQIHCLRPILPRDREALNKFEIHKKESSTIKYCESCDSNLGTSNNTIYCPFCGFLQRKAYNSINKN